MAVGIWGVGSGCVIGVIWSWTGVVVVLEWGVDTGSVEGSEKLIKAGGCGHGRLKSVGGGDDKLSGNGGIDGPVIQAEEVFVAGFGGDSKEELAEFEVVIAE